LHLLFGPALKPIATKPDSIDDPGCKSRHDDPQGDKNVFHGCFSLRLFSLSFIVARQESVERIILALGSNIFMNLQLGTAIGIGIDVKAARAGGSGSGGDDGGHRLDFSIVSNDMYYLLVF